MDEKAAIEEAVRSRLSILRYIKGEETGALVMLDLMSMLSRPDELTNQHRKTAELMQRFFVRSLTDAATFVFPAAECATLNDAWKSYPTTLAFPSDILAPSGLVYFAEPISDPVDDDRGADVTAMSWSVEKPEDNGIPLQVSSPDAYVLTILIYIPGSRTILREESRPRLYPIASVVWELGVEGGGYLWEDAELNELATRSRTPYVKLLLSFFSIIRQRLVEAEEPKERDKSTANRLKHARRQEPRLNTSIKVVRFRQHTGSGYKEAATPSGRHISVRYWTRPFWRWQWYRSTGENKPILIRPHQRGPEGAPVTGRDRIFLPPTPLKDR